MSFAGRAAVAFIVLAPTCTAIANAQRDCVRIEGVTHVSPGGDVRRNERAPRGVQIRNATGPVIAARPGAFSSASQLSIVQRFIVHLNIACKEQRGRLTLAPLFVAKDGALVTLPMRTERATDTLSTVLYSMPADSSNQSVRSVAVPGGGSLLVDWLRGPLVIVLQRLGIRLRVTGTRFLVVVSPDGQEAYVLVESGSIEVVGSSISLTAGKLWRIVAGLPETAPRIEEAADPAAARQLSDAARFDEGLLNVSRPFFKSPAGLATVGAIGALVVLQLVRHDCGGTCAVVVSIPIP